MVVNGHEGGKSELGCDERLAEVGQKKGLVSHKDGPNSYTSSGVIAQKGDGNPEGR